MALDDDVISRAIESAEAKMADNALSATESEEDTLEVETSNEEAHDQAEQEIQPETKESKASERARDKEGKFARHPKEHTKKASNEANNAQNTDINDQEANAETVSEETQETEVAPEIPAPAFWSTERKALFAKAPRELQEVIAARELELQQQMSRLANKSQRSDSFEKRLYSDLGNDPQKIEAHRAKLKLSGLNDEIDELHRYRAWDAVFRSDVKTAITDLMKKNGLTPADFNNDDYVEDTAYSAEISQLRAETQAAKKEAEEIRAHIQREKEENLRTQVESFKNSKDSYGNVRRSFVEMYAPQMYQTLEQIQTTYPQYSLQEALGYAYDHVLGEARKAFGVKVPMNGTMTPTPSVDSKKAKAASGSVSGSPVNAVAPKRQKNGNFKDRLADAIARSEAQLGLE